MGLQIGKKAMFDILVRFGGVNPADIKGMRAPFLAVGGDKMFNMLSRSGFNRNQTMMDMVQIVSAMFVPNVFLKTP